MTYQPGIGQSHAPFTDINPFSIARQLTTREPKILPPDGRRHAAVAMLLRQGQTSPEMLFIERAVRDGDPWSGDLGFPGGKVEEEDGGTREAAEREVQEEVGLDLAEARYLGRLDDLTGAHLPVLVSCFVWYLEGDCDLRLGEEAVDAFWVPFPLLLDPERRVETTVLFRGAPLVRPAIRLFDPGRRVLWGITYRLVTRFFHIMLSAEC